VRHRKPECTIKVDLPAEKTACGIQICDQADRVNCIVPTPNGRIANLVPGGAEFDILFATCGDKVFMRKVKVHGANAFQDTDQAAGAAALNRLRARRQSSKRLLIF
jgi:hypothetical protein